MNIDIETLINCGVKLLQKKASKKKSIFEKVKELKREDGKSGVEEINYLYLEEPLAVDEQEVAANKLCGQLLKCFKEKTFNFEFDFFGNPLITFFNVFINKINILVQEERIQLDFIKTLTKSYVFESFSIDKVKVGLVLAEKYLEAEELKEAIEVFTKSGEYVFYLGRAIKNMPKCNSYLLDLLKKSKGAIRIFALTNLEILSEEINDYILEEGYKDKLYENILMEYVLISGNLSDYLNAIQGETVKINKLSVLIYNHLNIYRLKDSQIKYTLILKYLPVALKGNSYLTLVSIITLWNQLRDVKEVNEIIESLKEQIEESLSSKKWTEVFLNELLKNNHRIKDVIAVAEYYDFMLTFDDLEPYFVINPLDFEGYLYLTMMGKNKDKLKLLEFFKEWVQLESLLTGAENISSKSFTAEDNEYILLCLLINGCRDIYPEGKDLAIRGLSGKVNDVRSEAVKIIKYHKKELSLKEKEIIKTAFKKEPNFEIKSKLKELCEEFEEGIVEFVSTKGLKIKLHMKDAYLLSSMVAGIKYRNRDYLRMELGVSKIYNLILEESNTYDKNAIKIVGESGFVIGYVPRKDNYILSNLLRGNRYLYCTIKEFDLEKNYIGINIYLSFKNVIKEAENLIQMMTSDGGDFEN